MYPQLEIPLSGQHKLPTDILLPFNMRGPAREGSRWETDGKRWWSHNQLSENILHTLNSDACELIKAEFMGDGLVGTERLEGWDCPIW